LKQGKTFLSIDETSFGRNGFELKGYSEIGKKLFVRKNVPRMTTTSVIACASSTGWINTQSSQKANNTESFLKFLQSLNLGPDMVVLLDNVSFHHSKAVKDFLASKFIQVLYTPPYSPWFNPIELCFSSVKRHFRKNQDIEQAFVSVQSEHFGRFFQKSLHCVDAF
jgi:transposase